MPRTPIIAALLLVFLSSRPIGQVAHKWTTYTNSELGFSLRYPTDLFELEVSNQKNGVPGHLTSVDFITRAAVPEQGQHIRAFRIDVRQHAADDPPRPPGYYRQFRNFKALSVGGRPAAQYVYCGSAACHWQIDVVVGSREFEISTGVRVEDEKTGPDNARYPLLSMIESITFDPSPSK